MRLGGPLKIKVFATIFRQVQLLMYGNNVYSRVQESWASDMQSEWLIYIDKPEEVRKTEKYEYLSLKTIHLSIKGSQTVR